ncbi:hypothetical protein DB346_21585 [Verrucomicrobia bacterium LW23]|nr:hypothetical protein DB346_21585 [Verrucomicrobia bacterium LW23]
MDETPPPHPQPSQRTARPNGRALNAWSVSVILAVMLAFYVLSMVPVGCLYSRGYLTRVTWHENLCRTLYQPLLTAVEYNTPIAEAVSTYENLCEKWLGDPRASGPFTASSGNIFTPGPWWGGLRYNRLAHTRREAERNFGPGHPETEAADRALRRYTDCR